MSYGLLDMTESQLLAMTEAELLALPETGTGGSGTTPSVSCAWSSSAVSNLIQAISDLASAVQDLQTDVTAIKAKTDYLPDSTATTAIANSVWGRTGQDTTSRTLDSSANSAIATAVWGTSTKEVTIASSQASTFAKTTDITTPPNTTDIAHAVWGRTGSETGDALTARTLTTNIGATVWTYTNGLTDTSGSRTLTSGGSSVSASDIWTYGDNSDMTEDIAAAVWGYLDANESTNSRTLTSGGGSGGLTAADVWNYGNAGSTITTRTIENDVTVSSTSIAAIRSGLSTFDASTDTVTVNSTQATEFSAVTSTSGLATSTDLSTLSGKVDEIKAKTDNLPNDTETVLDGLSTFDPTTTAVTLGSLTTGIGSTATNSNTIASKEFINSVLISGGSGDGEGDGESVSGSAVAEALTSIEEAIQGLPDIIWGRAEEDTTSRTLTTVAGLGIASESTVKTLVGENRSSQTSLGIKDTEGNTSVSLIVTRDSNNQIISIK